MAKTTLFSLEEQLATLKSAINADAEWISEKAANPETSMDDIEAKKKHRDELQARYDLVKSERDRLAAEEKAAVEKTVTSTDEDKLVTKKAAFYRAVATKQDAKKAYEGLGAIPANNADLGTGDYLLPKNVSDTLITEPVETNPLREIAHVTNISGYEEPRIGFTIEDADLADVTDKQTAKEIEMKGDSVAYGRFKAKVKATVKDTVIHGTDTNLVATIESNLRGAMAKREKYFAFLSAAACGTDTAHAHMSFYNPDVIPVVEGATMFDAIVAAFADLGDDFSEHATVVMRKSDYYSMISTLANGSEALFSDKPASILGIPVKFCELAVTPVVGDFNYYGINYDIGAMLDSDKDVDSGEYKFVLTAWGDQQIRLASAFRLAVLGE